jgi:hypothetical protein
VKQLKVKLQRDHLERMAGGRKPVAAIAELVWNAVDADATLVDVEIEENRLGAIDKIRVVDNGHGISHKEASAAFSSLGGSHKKPNQHSPGGRLLHGRAGEGRFSAFGVGKWVKWKTRWREGEKLFGCTIEGSLDDLGTFELGDPTPLKSGEPGTEVVISGIDKPYGLLRSKTVHQQFTEIFALYLREYSKVRVSYDGKKVDPKLIENLVRDYDVGPVALRDGTEVKAKLTVIEWKIPVDRALLICDAGGFALTRKQPGIQAPNFNFTVYLKSDYFRELEKKHLLEMEDLEPDLNSVLEAAKDVMRGHFRKRAEENAGATVERWKSEKAYPFEGPPKTVLEEVERKVFDVVALNINNVLPEFGSADPKSTKLSLFMLKQSLEQSPHSVQMLVQEVLDLPKEKQTELSELLERTTLTAIINASKMVADRLNFIAGLEVLVFQAESKAKLLERQQLHRILAENTWIFGEEFNLTVDDQGLQEVLNKHLEILGRKPDPKTTPTSELSIDGKQAIVDLMLSRVIPQTRADEHEHLVIELKRPSKVIDAEVQQQIERYAFSVAKDERFRDTNTRWVFWAVSNEVDEFVRMKTTRQANRQDGILHESEDRRITIWVKTWAQVIDSCKARLRFFSERLQYMANQDSGVAHLQKTYDKYLPKHLKAGDKNAPVDDSHGDNIELPLPMVGESEGSGATTGEHQ